MSGIVGIVNFDGAPVDRHLLSRMTAFMAFRGPDAQRLSVRNNVGFGHALLKATFESEYESQPFTLDNEVFIVADCRVDAQRELVAELDGHGQKPPSGATDVELVLRSYLAWGEDCVKHLLGDFAFAIWDSRTRRLFCARDHLGVKPFYYAHVGSTVILGNTLDCVRLHPLVSDRLNDLAIADYLLFGFNQDNARTFYSDIRRIPPAHTISWSPENTEVSRYWTMPIDEPVRFRRSGDYTERFLELATAAVDDRLRTTRAGIMMSGGLDSTSLAAITISRLRRIDPNSELHAFTSVFDGPDKTRYHAGLVARKLGIPIHYRDGSVDVWDPDWRESAVHTPEPVFNPMNLLADRAFNRRMASHSRVFFYGEGPDNALTFEWRSYLRFLKSQRRYGRMLRDFGHLAIADSPKVLLGAGLRRLKPQAAPTTPFHYPGWLDAEFESAYDLKERWRQRRSGRTAKHPVRPVAHDSFAIPIWQSIFEHLDAGSMMVPVEFRHPFTDLRLLRYMLSVPVFPWCRSKYLVRRAVRGLLPEVVRRTRKYTLPWDPVFERVRASDLPAYRPDSRLRCYVNISKVPSEVIDEKDNYWGGLRPRFLEYWLGNIRQPLTGDSKNWKEHKTQYERVNETVA